MKQICIASLIASASLIGCAEHASTAPEATSRAQLTALEGYVANPLRPFGGRCDTDITVSPPLAGDAANVLRLHIEYVCQLKHMGRATAITEQIVIFTSPTTATATSTGTYTAANGDQLFATWTGTATSNGPDNTFSGPETFAGGTGRFAGASGSTWVSGTASFATMTGQFTSVGTLAY